MFAVLPISVIDKAQLPYGSCLTCAAGHTLLDIGRVCQIHDAWTAAAGQGMSCSSFARHAAVGPMGLWAQGSCAHMYPE